MRKLVSHDKVECDTFCFYFHRKCLLDKLRDFVEVEVAQVYCKFLSLNHCKVKHVFYIASHQVKLATHKSQHL